MTRNEKITLSKTPEDIVKGVKKIGRKTIVKTVIIENMYSGDFLPKTIPEFLELIHEKISEVTEKFRVDEDQIKIKRRNRWSSSICCFTSRMETDEEMQKRVDNSIKKRTDNLLKRQKKISNEEKIRKKERRIQFIEGMKEFGDDIYGIFKEINRGKS